MALLGAPVTLTIGIESQPYQGELSLTIPAGESDRVLRVTLVLGSEEYTEYEGTVAAGSDAGAWAVPHGCDTEDAWLQKAGLSDEDIRTGNLAIIQRF